MQCSFFAFQCNVKKKENVSCLVWKISSGYVVLCLDPVLEDCRTRQNIPTFTYLSILIAHKLRIDAVHSRTSNEIHISHSIHPSGHVPEKNVIRKKKKRITWSEVKKNDNGDRKKPRK